MGEVERHVSRDEDMSFVALVVGREPGRQQRLGAARQVRARGHDLPTRIVEHADAHGCRVRHAGRDPAREQQRRQSLPHVASTAVGWLFSFVCLRADFDIVQTMIP